MTKSKSPPQDPLTYRLFNEIGIIDQLSKTAFRKVMPAPLNTAMFGVLNHFVRLGDGKTPSALASAFQVTRPSMTATLAKLERAGLVRIAPGDCDGRTKLVWITEEGRAARMEAVKATQVLVERIEPQLEGFDLARLVTELGELRAILDADRD